MSALHHSTIAGFPRTMEPEILDRLPADDPHARRSRRDLRRINRAMGTLSIVLDAFDRVLDGTKPRTILELGAGDGSLLQRIARQQRLAWPKVEVTLLDRQDCIEPEAIAEIRAAGWSPHIATSGALEFLADSAAQRYDLVFANLFIHHLSSAELSELFAHLSGCSRAFVCCEPQRSTLALAGSHLVGLLGAGRVARFDAVASVHAGFRGNELSALWPESTAWSLLEYPAGLFSHCFAAIYRNQR